MKISVFGTGDVGLVTGVCFAEMGNDVICMDVDPKKVQMLRDGKSPIYEPGLDELVVKNVNAGRLHFTTSLAGLGHNITPTNSGTVIGTVGVSTAMTFKVVLVTTGSFKSK